MRKTIKRKRNGKIKKNRRKTRGGLGEKRTLITASKVAQRAASRAPQSSSLAPPSFAPQLPPNFSNFSPNPFGVYVRDPSDIGYVRSPEGILLPKYFKNPRSQIIKGTFTIRNLSDAFNSHRAKLLDEYNRVFNTKLSLGEEIINFTFVGPIRRFVRFQGLQLNNWVLLFILCNILSQTGIGISTCDPEKMTQLATNMGEEFKGLIVTAIKNSNAITVNIDCLDCHS